MVFITKELSDISVHQSVVVGIVLACLSARCTRGEIVSIWRLVSPRVQPRNSLTPGLGPGPAWAPSSRSSPPVSRLGQYLRVRSVAAVNSVEAVSKVAKESLRDPTLGSRSDNLQCPLCWTDSDTVINQPSDTQTLTSLQLIQKWNSTKPGHICCLFWPSFSLTRETTH